MNFDGVPVAQWIARRTSIPEVAGSSPARDEAAFKKHHPSTRSHVIRRILVRSTSTHPVVQTDYTVLSNNERRVPDHIDKMELNESLICSWHLIFSLATIASHCISTTYQ